MTILDLIILFVVVGIVLYLVNRYAPMQQEIKTLLNVAIVIILVLYLVEALGLLGPLNTPIRLQR